MTGQDENPGVSSFRTHLVSCQPGNQQAWDLVPLLGCVTLGELCAHLINLLKGPLGSAERAGEDVRCTLHCECMSSQVAAGGAQYRGLGRTLGSVAWAGLKVFPILAL